MRSGRSTRPAWRASGCPNRSPSPAPRPRTPNRCSTRPGAPPASPPPPPWFPGPPGPPASVGGEGGPRLLIKPGLVAAFCGRDEHLSPLVMRELWPVILALARLWPRPTPNHNIAFDAAINAGLARQHPEPEYRGFFETL